jgi:hypothetical protein
VTPRVDGLLGRLRSSPWSEVALWIVLYLAVHQLAVEIGAFGPSGLVRTLLAALTTAVFVLVALALIRRLSSLDLTTRAEVGLLALTSIVFLLLRPGLTLYVLHAVFHVPLKPIVALLPDTLPVWFQPVGDLFLVGAAASMGRLVARIIREPNLLLPAAIIATVVDFWGVYWGFVAKVSVEAPAVVANLSVGVPQVGAGLPPAGVELGSIGVGDFVFLALFFFCIRRFALNERRSFWFAVVALLATPWILSVVPVVPGLPFIAGAMVLANWREFHYSPEEKKMLVGMIIGLLVIAAVVVALALTRRPAAKVSPRQQERAGVAQCACLQYNPAHERMPLL